MVIFNLSTRAFFLGRPRFENCIQDTEIFYQSVPKTERDQFQTKVETELLSNFIYKIGRIQKAETKIILIFYRLELF